MNVTARFALSVLSTCTGVPVLSTSVGTNLPISTKPKADGPPAELKGI